MKKYAVVKIGGKQYKVTEGGELLVEKLNLKTADKDKKAKKNSQNDSLDQRLETLLISDGKTIKVGKPYLTKNVISAKVITEEEKGKKISVFKYKSKSRYRKKIGFRPKLTRLLIEKIA